jgi:hypothetical protein
MCLKSSDEVDILFGFFADLLLIMDKAECVRWENGWTTIIRMAPGRHSLSILCWSLGWAQKY